MGLMKTIKKKFHNKCMHDYDYKKLYVDKESKYRENKYRKLVLAYFCIIR